MRRRSAARDLIAKFLRLALLSCTALLAFSAVAQTYPTKPVRLVVGFAAGGGTDLVARLVAQRMGQSLGQTFVIENRPGAAGAIAIERVIAAPPDGYTMLMMPATIAVLPAVRSDLPFDIERALAPISLVATGPGILAVHPSVPVRNVKELIALARAKPGVLNYGSSGVGASTHLKAELFKSMAQVNIVMVPYKGTSELAVATASGEVDMSFPSLTAALPLMAARKVKALGVTSATRTALAPGLPTVSETGLPGYEHMGWYGMFAPAGVPPEVITRLNEAIAAAVSAPQMKDVLAKDGFEPKVSTPREFAAFMRREIAQNLKLMRASGVKAAPGSGT